MRRRGTRLLVMMAALALVAAACSSNDDGRGPTAGGTTTDGTTTGATGGTTDAVGAIVEVTLIDFEVTAEPSSTAAGLVTFQVQTSAQLGGSHLLSVLRTDLPADALPINNASGAVDITSSDLEVVDFTPPLGTGDTASLTVDLSAGDYVLICNIVNHYSLGMRTGFSVT